MPLFCRKCGKENGKNDKLCSKCQSPLQHGPLPVDTVLEGRYKIIKLVKSGGMGAVYKADDMKLKNICAVKELIPTYESIKKQKKFEKWFDREAELLAKLDHANLPNVSDYFVADDRYYLVMSFIEGDDLETILKKEGNPGLPEDRVIDWSIQILKVLDYLHNLTPAIIYRDIKPANIMVHKDGRAMLIDFGIARTLKHDSETVKTKIGTPHYSSHEQCLGKPEPRSDIYSLGATMHHLLTGVLPKQFTFEFASPSNFVDTVSPQLENIVMKSVQVEPDDRYSSAKEMYRALKPLKQISHFLVSDDSTVPLKRSRKKFFHLPLYCGLTALFILLLVFLGKYVMSNMILDFSWKEQESGTTVDLNDIFFIDKLNGWIGGDDGIILNTVDGGSNWKAHKTGISGWLNKVYFINNSEGWAVGAEEHEDERSAGIILRSSDGGTTWTVQKTGLNSELRNIKFLDQNHGWAIGTEGLILYTLNGGEDWEEQESNTFGSLEDIHFVDSLNGWIVGGRQTKEVKWTGIILSTSDGGVTWDKNENFDGRFFGVNFTDPENGWAVGTGLTEKGLGSIICHTSDGGISWKEKVKGFPLFLPDTVKFLDREKGWISGIEVSGLENFKGIVFETSDGGEHWTKQNRGYLPVMNRCFFLDKDTGWALASGGKILKYSRN